MSSAKWLPFGLGLNVLKELIERMLQMALKLYDVAH